jgi:hypothetical protein
MQFMSKAYNDEQMIAMLKNQNLKIQKMVQFYKNENLVELYKQITDLNFRWKLKKWLLWRTQYQLGCENAESWR